MSEVVAIILAAGRSSRFGSGLDTSKVLAPLNGKRLVRHVAEAVLASRCAEVVVVTGHAAEGVEAALDVLPLRFVHNRDFASGLASSLQAGIAALPADATGAIVLLADMPLVTAALIDTLITRFTANGAVDAIVPQHDGRWGNPVLLSRSLFAAIGALRGDQGARTLLADKDVMLFETFDDAVTRDVDTPSALREMESELKARDARPRS